MRVVEWKPGEPLPNEPAVVLVPWYHVNHQDGPAHPGNVRLYVLEPPLTIPGGDRWTGWGYKPEQWIYPALRVTGTPEPEDVAGLLAIEARAHVLVVDAQEACERFFTDLYLTGAGELATQIDQVIITGGQPEHVADVIRQCDEAGVPCWVMDVPCYVCDGSKTMRHDGAQMRCDGCGGRGRLRLDFETDPSEEQHTNQLADILKPGGGS